GGGTIDVATSPSAQTLTLSADRISTITIDSGNGTGIVAISGTDTVTGNSTIQTAAITGGGSDTITVQTTEMLTLANDSISGVIIDGAIAGPSAGIVHVSGTD